MIFIGGTKNSFGKGIGRQLSGFPNRKRVNKRRIVMPNKDSKGPKGNGLRDGHGNGKGKGTGKGAGSKKGGKKGKC